MKRETQNVRRKTVGTQNETREITMFTKNEEIEATVGAQFHCAKNVNASRSIAALLLGSAALLFAPQAALAQNECMPVGVDPSLNPGPDSYTCDQAEYDNGVTYDADGDLTVTFTPNISEIGETNGSGISLTGDGIENIVFDSATNSSEIESRNTVGPLLDVSTVDGDIGIDVEEVDADGQNPAGVTHGIRAIASGTGSVDITTTGNVDANSNNNPADAVGIEARSLGGGDVTLNAGDDVLGREYGVLASTTGAGDLTLDLSGASIQGAPDGIAAIGAATGSGLLTVNMNAGAYGSNSNETNTIVRTDAGGDAVINVATGVSFSGAFPGFGGDYSDLSPRGAVFADMTAAGGTSTTLNLESHIGEYIFGSIWQAASAGAVLLRGAGSGDFVINNQGGIFGGVDFSNATGDVTFNNFAPDEDHLLAGWAFGNADFAFGGGDDTVNNQPGALISTAAFVSNVLQVNLIPDRIFVETGLDFGAGADSFNNAGTLLVTEARFNGGGNDTGGAPNTEPVNIHRDPVAAEVTFSSLETFNNTGWIVFGSWVEASEEGSGGSRAVLARDFVNCTKTFVTSCLEFSAVSDTDREWSATLAMPGTAFVGSGDSTILLDAAFHLGRAQPDCYTGRGGIEDNFRLPGADCMDLTGGSTAGSTQVIVRDKFEDDQGAYHPDGIVIVDVKGGTSAAEHFTLSAESDEYNARYDAIDKGLFLYPLAYDAENQQHKLVSVPSELGKQMPLLVQGAQEVSRQATTAWHDRRQHARTTLGGETDHGAWAHIAQTQSERDVKQSVSVYDRRIDFDGANDFEQDTLTATFGKDFIFGGGANSAWVVGGMLGYARAQLDFDASPVRKDADFEGATAGIYGSFERGDLFLDAALSYGKLVLDDDIPSLNLFPEGTILSTDVYTLGAYAEGGMRFRIGELLQVEPLASLSFASADLDGMNVPSADPIRPGNEVFGDGAHDSLRGGLGARLRADSSVGDLLLRYVLTARVWEEFEDETDVRIASEGPDATVTDEFGGSFVDVRAGVSLSDLTGAVSGYLNLDAVSGDDYDSLGVSAGFRYQW